MRTYLLSLLALFLIILSGCSSNRLGRTGLEMPRAGTGSTRSMAGEHDLLWRGEAGGGSVEYWRDGIVTSLDGQNNTVFQLPRSAEAYASDDVAWLVAVVPPYYSVLIDEAWTSEEGIEKGRRIDLRTLRMGSDELDIVDLRELFDDAVLLQAFKAHPEIRKLLGMTGTPDPSTLNELLFALARIPALKQTIEEVDSRCLDGGGADVTTRPLTRRFTFKELTKEGLVITAAFDMDTTALCDGAVPIDITLPMPPSLQDALLKASEREEGFLMKDAGRVAGRGSIQEVRYFLNAR